MSNKSTCQQAEKRRGDMFDCIKVEHQKRPLSLWMNYDNRSGPDKFHRQPVSLTTLSSAFRYIREHDDWLFHL